jgi:hypothetical protein
MKPIRSIGVAHGVVMLPVTVFSTLDGYDGEASLKDAGVLFHEPIKDYPQLRFAELPLGWKIVEIDKLGQKHNLIDDKGRVRATMRHTYDFTGAISMRRIRIRATMRVACPFIFSFRGKKEGQVIARIRQRYGSEVKSMPPIARKQLPNVIESKAQQYAFLREWLDVALPKWKTSAKYWENHTVTL